MQKSLCGGASVFVSRLDGWMDGKKPKSYTGGWKTVFVFVSDYNYVTLCLGVRLIRKLSIYVITMYLPSISLVALSWVGFWIDKRAIPARASLSITTILAEITLITGTANQ